MVGADFMSAFFLLIVLRRHNPPEADGDYLKISILFHYPVADNTDDSFLFLFLPFA